MSSADDHTILQDGLRKLQDRAGEITIIGEAASGNERLRLPE
jgi:hypothetical protein